MAEISSALLYSIQGFEGWNELTSREELDHQTAIAHSVHAIGEALGIHPDAGRVSRPSRHHAPHRLVCGNRRRCRRHAGGAHRAGHMEK